MEFEVLKRGNVLHGDSGNEPKTPPHWMDMERFKRGQQFFQRHFCAYFFGLHCALIVGFGLANLDRPLAYTRNSITASRALVRYLKTFAHIILWNTENVWDEKTNGHKSTQRVRNMHATVRNDMESKHSSKSYITQYDLTIVQSGFMASVCMYPARFGIICSKEEVADYVFFWRGIGYLLGLKDEFNLCSGSYEEFYSLGKEIEYDLIYRGIRNPPKDFEVLANAYVDAVNSLFKFRLFTKEAVTVFTFNIMRLPIPENVKLTCLDRLRVYLYRAVTFCFRWVPFFESLFNFLLGVLFKVLPTFDSGDFAKEAETVLDNVALSNCI